MCFLLFVKAADIATFIVQKKDLGTKAPLVELVEEKRHHLGTGKKFWSAIGGLQTIACKCCYKFQHSKPNHVISLTIQNHTMKLSLTTQKTIA